jgi:hypothetical protein
VQFIIPSTCGKLPKEIGMPSGGSLTADQWLLLATVYGPIIVWFLLRCLSLLIVDLFWQIPEIWRRCLPMNNPDLINDRIRAIQQIESDKEAKKKKAQEAQKARKAATAEERARMAAEKKAEKERITAEKKAEKERIAAEKKAEKARIAAEKKAEKQRITAEKKVEKERIAAQRKGGKNKKVSGDHRDT